MKRLSIFVYLFSLIAFVLSFGGSVSAASLPTVTTQPASSITQTSAVFNGNITSTGGVSPRLRGFVYGLTTSYEIGSIDEEGVFNTGSFNANVSALSCGTLYHYRAYATNENGTGYGSDVTFTTSTCSGVSPTVTTQSATLINQTTARLNGNITSVGSATPKIRGFEYGTTTSYGMLTSDEGSFSTGAFYFNASSLTCGTLYHYRAYAANIVGTGYGSDVTFTTSPCASIPPTLTTQSASSITQTTATLNGNITSIGTATPTTRGFQYGTTTSYGQISSNAGSFSTGSFNLSVSSLDCATTYHYRSYATSTAGTGYGSDVTFTTSACSGVPPTVTSQSATSITQTSAGFNGNITSIGTATPTTRGFQYGTTTSYGTNTTDTGSFTTGEFTTNISSLTCATTYHYRSYAINSAGIGYGSDVTLTTSQCSQSISIPTLTTSSASSLTRTTAALNGSITDTGGEDPTTRGFQYGTTTSYGTNTTDTGSFTTGAFTANISSLTCATTYHYRSYAINSAGTGYGEDQSFTTSDCATSGGGGGGGSSGGTATPSVITTLCQPGQLFNQTTGLACTTFTTPTTTTPNITRTLKLTTPRMQGNDVKELQTYLNSKGYDCGTPDGVFGTKSKQAVMLFQQANGLTADGSFGPNTRAVLFNNQTPTTPTTITPPIAGPARTLKLTTPRMQGNDVKELQTYLNSKGYDCGTPDGVFGTKSKQAVMLFQQANGLTADGIVGPGTRGVME